MNTTVRECVIKFLPFDTEIFGIKCGRVEIKNNSLSRKELKCILDETRRQQIEHLVAKVPSEWVEICNLLEDFNFRFKVCSLGLESKITHDIDNVEDAVIYEGSNDCRLIEITEKAFSESNFPVFAYSTIESP